MLEDGGGFSTSALALGLRFCLELFFVCEVQENLLPNSPGLGAPMNVLDSARFAYLPLGEPSEAAMDCYEIRAGKYAAERIQFWGKANWRNSQLTQKKLA